MKQMLANAQGRPAEKAFAAVFATRLSPTRYGKGSAKDPAAFRRISAAAADWFAAGHHVTIAGKAIAP